MLVSVRCLRVYILNTHVVQVYEMKLLKGKNTRLQNFVTLHS